jgi:hypothetical protein
MVRPLSRTGKSNFAWLDFSSQAKLTKGNTTTEVLFGETCVDGTFQYRRRQCGGTQATNEACNVCRWEHTGEDVESPKIDPVPAVVINGQVRAQFCDQFPHRGKIKHLSFDKLTCDIFLGQVPGHIKSLP